MTLASHPSRVRGLKHQVSVNDIEWYLVAPLAGAWIETGTGRGAEIIWKVAPLAGAWIETSVTDADYLSAESHPSRVRGLKLVSSVEDTILPSVAPLAGAWIETYDWPGCIKGPGVAPLAGAWIETAPTLCFAVYQYVAPLAGAWIETG